MSAKAIVKAEFIPAPLPPAEKPIMSPMREVIWTEFYVEAKELGYTEEDAKWIADALSTPAPKK